LTSKNPKDNIGNITQNISSGGIPMAQIQVNFFSRSLSRQVTINAIIPADRFIFPPNAEKPAKPFKTMYLLHGIFGNYTDWASCTRIQEWASEKNLAVIMPSADNSFYVDNPDKGDMYGEFIGKELVEITRDLFHLSHKREDTFIAGLSMGGFGAIRNGLKYSETFGYIAGLSAALVLDHAVVSNNDTPTLIGRRSYFQSVFGDLDKLLASDINPEVLLTSLKQSGKPIPKMYICCGTEDNLIETNQKLHKFLQDNGIEHIYIEDTGAHDWDYWNLHIKKVLDWLPL